jgi:hypothetical protein
VRYGKQSVSSQTAAAGICPFGGILPQPVYQQLVSDACDITGFRFPNSDSTGLVDNDKSGSQEDPALITITYPVWMGIPNDNEIEIKHTGRSVHAGGPDWEAQGGSFVRYYLVTAESGKIKYYRVTAAPSFDIHNAAEWQAARTFMSGQPNGSAGSPVIFRPNIVGDFAVPGITGSTITGTYKEVRLTGTKTIRLSTNGSLIRAAADQTFVIDGVTLQGTAENNTALVYISGSNSAVELHSGEFKDNKTSSTGGGVFAEGGAAAFRMTGGTISGNEAYEGAKLDPQNFLTAKSNRTEGSQSKKFSYELLKT